MLIVIMISEFLNQDFIEWVGRAGRIIENHNGNSATIVHHNDADGICSAAILSKLCEHLNIKTELVCLEKVHPVIVDRIHSKYKGNIVIYTDLAGLAADMIDIVNADRCTVWIIDHHPAKLVQKDNFFVLDSEILGISGDMFVSASTLNYLLAVNISDEMRKYAYLAVIGSVGDYHDRSGGVLGFDRFALGEALSLGQVKVKIEGARERYYVNFFDEYADIIAKRLTNLGTVGYERKGYRMGIKACLEGFNEKTLSEAEKLEEIKMKKFEDAVQMLSSGGLNVEKYTQWFHIGDAFSPMGVKAVGEFCQNIKDAVFLKEGKYLLGFQNCPRYIPDLGEVDLNVVKVSGRMPTPLERKVFAGDVPGYDTLFPAASEIVGGVADATHKIAAASLIDRGREKDFVRAIETLRENSTASSLGEVIKPLKV